MKKEEKNVFDIKNEQSKTIKELVTAFSHINKALNIECNCKNQVYTFILENGLFDKYNEWNKTNPTRLFS